MTHRRGLLGPWTVVLLAVLVSGLFLSPVAAGNSPGPLSQVYVDEDIERSYKPDFLHLATGDPDAPEDHGVYPWPFDLDSIGHTIASYQNYGSPYFHHGIDIMAPDGTDVHTQSGGQIVNVGNYGGGSPYYWEVAVLDPDGFVWQFHHIDEPTIPQYIWNKYYEYLADPVNGGFVVPGTYIGDIVLWPVWSFGKIFNHIHLNILGEGAAYVNGFAFHDALPDDDPPEILQVGLLKNGQIYYGNEIEGPYSLYVHAQDLVLDNVYYVPPYEVTYSIDGGPTHTVWRFDTLPGGADDEAYIHDYYVVPPTCGDYDCRQFYVDLGFTLFEPGAELSPGASVEGTVASFPGDPGLHTVLVTVTDDFGNVDSQSYTWTVLGGTMHVKSIVMRTLDLGFPRKIVLAQVRIVDGENQPLDQATVAVEWTYPNGWTISQEALSNVYGRAKFHVASRITGIHQLCVTDLTKPGFTYEPDQNVETCDTVLVP